VSRASVRAIALSCLVGACTHPSEGGTVARTVAPKAADVVASAVAPAVVPLASPGPPRFHVALVSQELDGSSSRTAAKPCAALGRTLLCSMDAVLVSDADGVRKDPVLERAAKDPRAAIEGTVRMLGGRWPDAAWLVTTTHDDRDHAYAWADDHWAPLAAWRGAAHRVVRWGDGVLGQRGYTPVGARVDAVTSFAADGTEHPGPAMKVLTPEALARTNYDDLQTVDGTLFVVGAVHHPDRLVVEQRTSAGSGRVDTLAPELARARLWAPSARDVVAFGGATQADEHPVLRHFDGETWSSIEAPPGIDFIVAYDRSDSGTERVFAYRGEELSLWTRGKGTAWESIPLPRLAPGETLSGRWLTSDDAWLDVVHPDRPSRLVRLRPVTHVVHLGSSGVQVVPATPEDDLAPAEPVAAVAPPADPSPFHDAVVGHRDPPEAQLPNRLRLCPKAGRAFVCGTDMGALVATEDGVVSASPAEARLAAEAEAHYQLEDIQRPRRIARAAWPKVALPSGVDAVVAYDRAPGGVERLFAYEGTVLGLYERRANGEWSRVRLPASPGGDEIHGAWLVDDDAWLLMWPKDLEAHGPRLMRMKPVKKVWTYPRELPGVDGW